MSRTDYTSPLQKRKCQFPHFLKKIWLSNVAQIKQINVFMHFRSCHLPFLKAEGFVQQIRLFRCLKSPSKNISSQISHFKKSGFSTRHKAIPRREWMNSKVQIQNDIFKSQRNRGQKCCHCAVIHYLKNKVGVVDFANAQGLVKIGN